VNEIMASTYLSRLSAQGALELESSLFDGESASIAFVVEVPLEKFQAKVVAGIKTR
jgi:hypothetical protein